jgi:phosphoglucomutase
MKSKIYLIRHGTTEAKGEESRFIFGFEESYGYLSGSYVRDKDAVNASMLIAEMTAYYKQAGKTLVDILYELYQKYGYYKNELIEFWRFNSIYFVSYGSD